MTAKNKMPGMEELKNKKILIVDDNDEMRNFLIENLISLGFVNIIDVNNVKSAKEKVLESFNKAESIDLILCDHHMPDNSGLELISYLRMSLKFRSLPFIAVTSDSDRSVVLPYLTAGADSFIVKPVNPRDLLSKIERIFEMQK